MFFENEYLSFRIIEIWDLKQKNVRMMNRGRGFFAISFRSRSDAVLKTEGAEYAMGEGTVAFVPAHLDYLRTASVDEMTVVDFETDLGEFSAIECFTPRDGERFARLFQRILSCWKERAAGYRLKCAALFYEILAECYAENQREAASPSRIRPSVDYMRKEYRRPDLTVSEIAARSFMSEVYFRRLFKDLTGLSPKEYLIEKRIAYAKDLLLSGGFPVSEVALLSGYGEPCHFSREFSRREGVSPAEFAQAKP